MNTDEKMRIVKQVAAEIIQEDELRALFEQKQNPLAYDGFEPSGNIHIAQGLMRAITVNKLASTGIRFIFWIADWFALMNNKLGGDLEKIQITGQYYIEVWKACGMDLSAVTFRWASKEMDSAYWLRTLKISTMNSVARIQRCAQIMGRGENDTLTAAQIFYPCMQCNDIFHLGVDIAQLGMDQRKVNVLAREVAEKLHEKKPIAIHHHMLRGLQSPDATSALAKKMSKSNPDSAIFMTDSKDQVDTKFSKAYCPEGQVDDNPVLEYFCYIIFERSWLIDNSRDQAKNEKSVIVERSEQFGGNRTFDTYGELEQAFKDKQVHPIDLKKTATKYINTMLERVRQHFTSDSKAKTLLDQVGNFRITR